jgi:hypothetical protein
MASSGSNLTLPGERRDATFREPSVGLCAGCRYSRAITGGRGARFWLCRRSETDPRFPKYPMLPVSECAGFELPPAKDQP